MNSEKICSDSPENMMKLQFMKNNENTIFSLNRYILTIPLIF